MWYRRSSCILFIYSSFGGVRIPCGYYYLRMRTFTPVNSTTPRGRSYYDDSRLADTLDGLYTDSHEEERYGSADSVFEVVLQRNPSHVRKRTSSRTSRKKGCPLLRPHTKISLVTSRSSSSARPFLRGVAVAHSLLLWHSPFSFVPSSTQSIHIHLGHLLAILPSTRIRYNPFETCSFSLRI